MNYLKKLKIQLVKGEYKNPIKGQVKDPEHIFSIFKKLKDKAQETVIGVYLNEKLEVIVYDILSIGGEDVALVIPHEIFAHAVVVKAQSIILIHNHPSGNVRPSQDDMHAIEVLSGGAAALRMTFLDFIIVGDDSYWSMFEEERGGRYDPHRVHG